MTQRNRPDRPRFRPGDIRIGPWLIARGPQTGAAGARWRVAVLLLTGGRAEPPDLQVDGVGLPVPPRFLAAYPAPAQPDAGEGGAGDKGTKDEPEERLWRYDFAVPRGVQDGRAGYRFDDLDDSPHWQFAVPGTLSLPRLAYGACGGCEDEADIPAAGLVRNARWSHLLGRHRADPFHLLLLGGDQIYADGLWRSVPALAEVAGLTPHRRARSPASPALPAQLDRWYLEIYRHTWTQPETAAVFASVPLVCMWDDHDIIDGWGSLPPAVLDSPIYHAVFAAAARGFRRFQLGLGDDERMEAQYGPAEAFDQGFVFNGIGILAPDLRSGRRPDRVMTEDAWTALESLLAGMTGCRHLLVMSSVPLVFPDLGLAERLLHLIPGRQALEDDLRDQWRSPAHRLEWTRMVRLLAGFAKATGARVTVLSGEVHFGAAGVLKGPGVEIRQLVSSGVVHPPPPAFVTGLLDRLGRREERLADGLTLRLEPFAESGRRVIACRNWLDLELRQDGVLDALWHAESGPSPLSITLSPGG